MSPNGSSTTALSLLACLTLTAGYKFFQTAIPNGDSVINPCDGTIWNGVGHINKEGGGERNVFGKAFASEGKKWTRSLCMEDSDGDGLTNGQELGDPECIWTPGNTPASSQNTSHPGICEPLNATRCQGQKIECKKEWSCPAINSPDVTKLTVTIPRRKVPAQETTYICYNTKIPSDRLYDIVASKSVIDNTNVMHHMTMYGCTGELDESLEYTVDNCDLRNSRCEKMVHIWSIGMEDFCQEDYKAFRFGKGLTTWVSIQYHWNNPRKIDHYTDSSGVEIFYTPKLRRYAEDIFQTGDGAIFIPPNSKDFKVTGLCSHQCSKQSFQQTINITSVLLHMHGTGTHIRAKHYRQGRLLRQIAEDNPYRYDKPVIHRFDKHPIEFRPGDELKVECTFNTVGKDNWVINGPGTKDEMCVTLISYYPANEFRVENCFSVKGRCGRSMETVAPGCQLKELMTLLLSHAYDVVQSCDIDHGKSCPQQCHTVIGWIRKQFPNCFDNQPSEVSRFIWSSYIKLNLNPPLNDPIFNAFKGCDLYLPESVRNKGYMLPAM